VNGKDDQRAIVFGPVPSRRLGRSLGINNIPPKTCSYSCAYCQLGRTTRMQTERLAFHLPEEICLEVLKRVDDAKREDEPIDSLTFVPDGEPTLDIRLGEAIDLLDPVRKRIAVISNASLLWRADVRGSLVKADWVSVKVDTVDEDTWRTMNRPHKELRLGEIQDGLVEFAEGFGGRLVTETMLVKDVNDDEEHLEETAAFLGRLKPAIAYIAAPIRPPAETWVEVPGMDAMIKAYESFTNHLGHAELLIGYEGNEFGLSRNIEESLLGITSVHPMREEAIDELLGRAGEDWEIVQTLVAEGRLLKLDYQGRTFYVRNLPGRES